MSTDDTTENSPHHIGRVELVATELVAFGTPEEVEKLKQAHFSCSTHRILSGFNMRGQGCPYCARDRLVRAAAFENPPEPERQVLDPQDVGRAENVLGGVGLPLIDKP